MSSISGATATDAALRAPGANRFSEMSTEDFIQVIFTELTNQDPLEPSDTGALLDQLNSIRSIEADLSLERKLSQLVGENQLATASGMIGKFVEGRTSSFDQAEGFVLTVRRSGEEIKLELDTGQIVPLNNVETIVDPSIFQTP